MILYHHDKYNKFQRIKKMSSLIVKGGTIRGGEVNISGNKNAVLPMIAALLAEYAASHDAPLRPHMLEMVTMPPLRLDTMPGASARMR